MTKSINIECGTFNYTVPVQWLLEYLKDGFYSDWPSFANDDEILFDFNCNYSYDEAEKIYDVAVKDLFECVEVCPHCDQEQCPLWDASRYGYEINCPTCGKLIMLCDECFHSDDNERMFCDWFENCGCFRKNINKRGKMIDKKQKV